MPTASAFDGACFRGSTDHTMTVVFYVSGHGFGHASRQVEVINRLGTTTGCRILIRSAVSEALLARTLRVPWSLAPAPCDTGIVQASSIRHDDEATVREALAFYRTFDARVASECAQLAGEDVRLIVGDIPPLAFPVAARLGVPSVAIANFTWDWIYEDHPGFLPDGRETIAAIRAAYRTTTLALELPMSGGFEVFPAVGSIPLIARRSTRDPVETRAYLGLPSSGPIVLLSFGGYGLPDLDLSAVDCADDWTVVTTDRVTPSTTLPRHVRGIVERSSLSGDFRYEDLVAAVDVVLTKPGYGIIAECASTDTALLYTSRGRFREYDVLVDAMPALVRSRFISQADLLAGRWRDALEAVLTVPGPTVRPAVDGADVAAARLTEWVG